MLDTEPKLVQVGADDTLAAWLDAELRKVQAVPEASAEVVQAAIEALRLAAPSAIDQLRGQHVEAQDGTGLPPGAREDRLTGVGDRRGVEDRLATEWERSRRYDRPLAVVAIEVDGGLVRDDVALRSVAASLVQTARASDYVGRIVGEEFVLICPEADEEGARGVTRKVVEMIRGSGAPDGGEKPLPVSAGWATRDGADTAQDLLQQADRALSGASDPIHASAPVRDHSHVGQSRPPRDDRAEREAHYRWMHRR